MLAVTADHRFRKPLVRRFKRVKVPDQSLDLPTVDLRRSILDLPVEPRRSILDLPVEICRRILLLLPPIDVPQLLLASRGIRRIFRPTNSEIGFALTHVYHHYVPSPGPKKIEHQDAYLCGIPFSSLPPVYSLSMVFSDCLKHHVRRKTLVKWLTGEQFGFGHPNWNPRKGPPAARRRIERLFKTALALDWNVTKSTVALGGATMDKNLFLELLIELAAAIDSLKAVKLVLELQRAVVTKATNDPVPKDDSDVPITGSEPKQTDRPEGAVVPNVHHVVMHFACKYESEPVIRYLLDSCKEDFERMMDHMRAIGHGYDALFYLAARTQNRKILELLLERHARRNDVPKDKEDDGSSPSWRSYDQDLCSRDLFSGDSALHVAKTPQIASLLLDHGADPNTQNLSLETPLHAACKGITCGRQLKVIIMLLEHGADASASSNKGKTPLHHAASAKEGEASFHLQAARVLLSAGAGPDDPDNRGRTPLHSACKRGNGEMIKLLVSHGANLTIGDNDGKTPLDLLRDYSVKRHLGNESDSSLDEVSDPEEVSDSEN
ncbi:hypothetical protein HDU96_009383 [Phlyctochytrium bullatum]|nr:hypothetical protein HDU96_009383 [Phlyctochytrium bullatum]